MSHHTHDTLDCPGCGHAESYHKLVSPSGYYCSELGCTCREHSRLVADTQKEASPAWLNKPNRDGYWIRSHEGKLSDVLAVRGELAVGPNPAGGVHVGQFKGSKWFFACAFPTPPPPPLPKQKQVTMSARVESTPGRSDWRARVTCSAFPEQIRPFISREAAVTWVRENYGVEPEVENKS